MGIATTINRGREIVKESKEDRLVKLLVLHVFMLRAEGLSLRAVSRRVNISYEIVRRILCRGQYSWVQVSDGLLYAAAHAAVVQRGRRTQTMLEKVRRNQAKGLTQMESAKLLGVNQSTISRMLRA